MPEATLQSRSVPIERATPGGLPLELTSFIGRDREVDELTKLLASSRMLTLTGAGGSGKTRLALEVLSRTALPAAADVAWVELAAVDDAAQLPQQIVTACGVLEEIPNNPDALVRLLRDRSILLVLDNCEHLVDDCAAVAAALLHGCPGVRILATSREALGVKGERAWLVPPLSVPDSPTIDAALQSDAVRLFIERAVESAGVFELSADNVGAVVEICRRLDGIPLAIELAAARVRHLGVHQIHARLDDAFQILRSQNRAAVPRHRTLAAALDWSFELLPDDERALFRRLAVFRGGFTLDAAEHVGDGTGDVVDLLGRLVDRSLVAVREQGSTARYAMLETVLQYARRRLQESDDEADARRRHAEYVTRLVAEAEPHMIRPERRIWTDRMLLDIENIRDALDWSRTHDPDMHVRLAGMLWWFWFSTRHWHEARRVLDDALALPAAAMRGLPRARLLFAAGALAALQSRNEAVPPPLEEAVAIAREFGDAQLEAYALNYHGMMLAGEGRREAWDLCQPAAAWFEANGDLYGLRLSRLLLGTAAMGFGEPDEAVRQVMEGVRIARLYRQDRELAIALQTASIVYLRRGELERAETMLLEAVEASRRDPAYFAVALSLETLGELWCRRGRLLEGARLIGAGEATRARIGAAPFRYNAARMAEALPQFRAAAGSDAFDRAWAEGARLTPEAAMDEALEVGAAIASVPAPEHAAAAASAAATVAAAPAADAAQLDVSALGRFEVRLAGSEVPDTSWSYAKPKELLVYLLLHPAGAARDTIAGALWPTAVPAQSKNSFHVTLHHLRKSLGHPEWIVLDRDVYRLAADLEYAFDADRFERAARALLRESRGGAAADEAPAEREARIRAALALYGGDLLQDEPAGPWHEDPRSELRRLYLELKMQLGTALEAAGSGADAADVYQRVIAHDDLHEEAHRRLMVCWTRAGERSRALRHYERLTALLREVLDAEPDEETVELATRIRSGEPV